MYINTIHCCKKVLEANELAYSTKVKQFNHSKKLGFQEIW